MLFFFFYSNCPKNLSIPAVLLKSKILAGIQKITYNSLNKQKKGSGSMTKKDILELKRRMKKEGCSFTRMCGCYVDNHKNIILQMNETFLSLEEDEFFKYLEIAKKPSPAHLAIICLNCPFCGKKTAQKHRNSCLPCGIAV